MVPKSVNELTLAQYSRYIDIESSDLPFEDKQNQLIKLLTGWDQDYINNLPIDENWDKLVLSITKLRLTSPTKKVKEFITVNGKRYKACPPNKLNANQYTALKTFQEHPGNQYHLIASVLYISAEQGQEPRFDDKNHPEIANDFLKAKVGDCFGALFFYLKRSVKLNQISLLYFRLNEIRINQRMQEVFQGLQELGVSTAGSIQSIKSRAETYLRENYSSK